MAVLIGLHEVKANFETRLIRLDQRDADPPEFRALNPEGKVPTLVTGGRPLTEVAGILWYLARQHPEAALLPVGDAEAEARVVSWMSFIASTIHPARRLGAAQAQAVYRIADERLGFGPWVLGDYSIADIHLFRLFWRFRGSLGADPASFPHLTAHYDRMLQRPAVQATLADDAAAGYSLPA